MRYQAKVDWWIKLLMYGTLAPLIIPVFLVPTDELFIILITIVLMFLLFTWIIFGSYYELRETKLFMKVGPFFGNIKYEKIKKIKKATGVTSSMALSKDRVEIITYGKYVFLHTTYISPLDREDFMIHLKHRCKNLEDRNETFNSSFNDDSDPFVM